MIFRHVVAVNPGNPLPVKNSDDLIRIAFTQEPTFRELVRACEGVPRDAINILQIAATRAQDERISMNHIRDSAKDWFERDKASYVNSNPEADALLHWIIKSVIGERKSNLTVSETYPI
jgi:replication-associated recombination protein RarA